MNTFCFEAQTEKHWHCAILDGSGNPCEQPKAAALTEEELEDYFKWLGVLLEWINGSLVRDHPDKFLPCNMFILFDLNLHLIIFFFPWKENGVMLTALK